MSWEREQARLRKERIAAYDAAEERKAKRAANGELVAKAMKRAGLSRASVYRVLKDGTVNAEHRAIFAALWECKPSEFLKSTKPRGRQPTGFRAIRAAMMNGYREGLSWRDFIKSQANKMDDSVLLIIFERGDAPDHFSTREALIDFARSVGVKTDSWCVEAWKRYELWRGRALCKAYLEERKAEVYDDLS